MKPANIRTLATVVLLALVALGLKALTLTAGDASLTDLLLNGARQLSQAGVRNLYL
jgi:hypothetical protein